jgi:hypothetical protein
MKKLIFLILIAGLITPVECVFSMETNQIKHLATFHGFEVSDLPDSEKNIADQIIESEILAVTLPANLNTISGCKGNWMHQGNGCMHCYESPYGTFHCCAGDTKQCDIPGEG